MTALATLAVLTLYMGAINRDITSPGEARAVQIAYEMHKRGDYILPSLRGEVSGESLTKPPLFHWLLIATAVPFDWQNFSLRLVPMAVTLISLWLVFVLGRRMFDAPTGAFSALVLASTVLFLPYGLSARIDQFFSVLILLAMTAFYNATVVDVKTKPLMVFFIATGLAVMAKGPAGAIIPFGTALVYCLTVCEPKALKRHLPLWGFLVFLAISLPWYALVIIKAPPDLVHNMFLAEPANWLEGKTSASQSALWWVYLPYLLAGLFPWSLFLPVALVFAALRLIKGHDRQLLMLLFWFLGGLVLFSVGGKKAARYLLPMLPAGALLIGWYFKQLTVAFKKRPDWGTLMAAALVSLLGLVAALALFTGLQDPEGTLARLIEGRTATDTASLTLLWQTLTTYSTAVWIMSAGLLVISIAAFVLLFFKRIQWAVFGYTVFAWILLAGYFHVALPHQAAGISTRTAAENIARLVPSGATLHGGGGAYQRSLHWYLRRDFDLHTQQTLVEIARADFMSYVFIMHRNALPEDIQTNRSIKRWHTAKSHITLLMPTVNNKAADTKEN
ncbi:MAG: hypothetical protein BMS9Abin15_0963 [Gammaproteobacteria bacterium]|nr:MAG: hypothetical protein BMS9Abin15_0963 [Gammaproteobacteria bacterium]